MHDEPASFLAHWPRCCLYRQGCSGGRAAPSSIRASLPPAPEDFPVKGAAPAPLPSADVSGKIGPAPPEATEITREQRRFWRYDRDRDGRITRNEMLSTRTDAFRKVDRDGNNLLTFEEWAGATVAKFDGADRDRNRELTAAEFATTRPKTKPKPGCSC